MDREITLRDYGRVVWSGRWLIVGAALLAGLVGLLVTFISSTTYSSTSRVNLGQATTITGVPITTALTNPVTAATTLRGEAVVSAVAQATGFSESRIRDAVTIALPRTPGQAAGNQGALASITVSDTSRDAAKRIIDAYTAEAFRVANQFFEKGSEIYQSRIDVANRQLSEVRADIRRYSQALERATSEFQVLAYSQLLSNAQSQSLQIRADLNAAVFALNKAQQIESPAIVDPADDVSSSTAAPRRVRTIVLAMILGLVIGVAVTFIWKGSPAGRAARTE